MNKGRVLQASLVSKEKFVLQEVGKPEPEKNQVLVDVACCGVCGSDLHAFHGTHPFMSFPVVMGHEFSGCISHVGRGVTDFQKGQKVTVLPVISCGKCLNCISGRRNVCQKRKILGGQVSGAYTETFAVNSNMVIPIPDSLALEKAALAEPVAVAVHTVKRSKLTHGEKVLVVGCGPIGFFIAQVLKALMKTGKLLVVDKNPFRVGIAEKNGLRAVVTNDDNFEDVLRTEFGNDLYDTVFECSGQVKVMDDLLGLARSGSRMVLVSILPSPQNMRNITSISEHELEVIGTSTYLEEDFTQAVSLLAEGKVGTDGVITHYFPLRDVEKAFTFLSKPDNEAFKVLLKM